MLRLHQGLGPGRVGRDRLRRVVAGGLVDDLNARARAGQRTGIAQVPYDAFHVQIIESPGVARWAYHRADLLSLGQERAYQIGPQESRCPEDEGLHPRSPMQANSSCASLYNRSPCPVYRVEKWNTTSSRTPAFRASRPACRAVR